VSGLNLVQIIGNLGNDPEMRYTANGSAVTTFRVAVSRAFGPTEARREETEWFTVVTWNKLAETMGSHLQKGRKVYVQGRLATRSWDDEKTGQKRYKTEVVANEVQFLDKAQDDVGGFNGPGDSTIIDPDDLPFEN
jgi:single-strand DNA-binding protein